MRVLSGGNCQSYTDTIVDALKEFEDNEQLQIVLIVNVTDLILEDEAVKGITYDLIGKSASYDAKSVALVTVGYVWGKMYGDGIAQYEQV